MAEIPNSLLSEASLQNQFYQLVPAYTEGIGRGPRGISGFDTDGEKILKIDKVRVDFEEL